MRTFLGCLLAVLPAFGWAEDWTVSAGEERVLSQASVHLQRLVLEDGAVLRVAPGLSRIELKAEQVWIGRNVRLLGAGRDGAPGVNGLGGVDAQGCEPGGNGQAGAPGEDGQAGVSVDLQLGLQAFDSLLIDVRGGHGGPGGSGGAGGMGGNSPTCAGGLGGMGGAAGVGGAGGVGGEVRVRYWSAGRDGLLAVSNYGPGLTLLTRGGQGAQPGMPGAGGTGGSGQLVKRPTGIKVFRNPGSPGAGGAFAAPGSHGPAGQFLIEAMPAPGLSSS